VKAFCKFKNGGIVMEITLEKIELVKDRTGVSYKEAKEALEAADGSVVDAIIAIEETVNIKQNSKVNDVADETIAKIKELVKKGNVTKISVKRDDETIVNIPVNVGIVGTIVAPWGIIAAAIAAFGFRCQIELTKDDGSVVDISERAENLANDVKEKGSVVVDEVVAKGSAVANDVKEKAPDVMNDIKEKSVGAYNTVKNAATDMWNGIKEKKEDIEDDIEEAFDIAEEKLDDIVEDIEK
jgi:polyhydroxyalkanoate synthesis regulator phasin